MILWHNPDEEARFSGSYLYCPPEKLSPGSVSSFLSHFSSSLFSRRPEPMLSCTSCKVPAAVRYFRFSGSCVCLAATLLSLPHHLFKLVFQPNYVRVPWNSAVRRVAPTMPPTSPPSSSACPTSAQRPPVKKKPACPTSPNVVVFCMYVCSEIHFGHLDDLTIFSISYLAESFFSLSLPCSSAQPPFRPVHL